MEIKFITEFFAIIVFCRWKHFVAACEFSLSLHGSLTPLPAWISNYIHNIVWDEIIYPFSNFNGAAVEVRDRICNFIPHFTEHRVIYPCWD